MIPELSIARVFQRELDALPLPPEDLWLPHRDGARASTIGAALAGAAFVLAVLVTVAGVRASQEAATVGDADTRVTPAPLPFGDCGAGARCVAPLPNLDGRAANLHRSAGLGYNLLVPGFFRKADDGAAALAERAGLLQRERFTARPADEDAAALARYGSLPPWDFVVEVYDGAVVSAAERARLDGCVVDCVTHVMDRVGREPMMSATWTTGMLVTHAYYLERNGRVLVLKYVVGPEDIRPPLVNESDLLRIVERIGLV